MLASVLSELVLSEVVGLLNVLVELLILELKLLEPVLCSLVPFVLVLTRLVRTGSTISLPLLLAPTEAVLLALRRLELGSLGLGLL